MCDNINVYIFTSDTTIMKYTNISATKLKVRGYISFISIIVHEL